MRLEAFQREITTIYQRHSNGWLPGRIFISNSSLLEMGPKRAALNTSFPAWLCRSYIFACKFIHFTEKFARKAWLCLLILVTTLKFENEMVRTWIKLLTDRSKLTFQRRILPRQNSEKRGWKTTNLQRHRGYTVEKKENKRCTVRHGCCIQWCCN